MGQAFLDLMTRSVAADDPQAGAAVDRHRQHISKWFYQCTPEIHAGLGELYVQDGRFTTRIDAYGEGLADYLSGAIAARYA